MGQFRTGGLRWANFEQGKVGPISNEVKLIQVFEINMMEGGRKKKKESFDYIEIFTKNRLMKKKKNIFSRKEKNERKC